MSKHVLITGATKGIGRACAERFAREGWTVTAVARTQADLLAMKKAFSGQQVTTITADLGTDAGIASIPVHPYDAIVLNAAIFAPGHLLGEEDIYGRLWRVNVWANHQLARRLLPAVRQQPSGHLVVIGSRGTDFQPPHLTAYVATKYALRGLYLGWESELLNSNVKTTLVAPGATLTSSWNNEEPPADILAPETVAEAVWTSVRSGITGRVVV
ncbi:SDR family oxidoreductase [Neolewinella aurantiaca]|uniref:SDR family oxidoreductase n=1 Tax=Neolewinella aurantiaca TaxID=2602767 RepID=A0A5C7FIG4_9BACT|nr:SDR family oxidoreductase [Neolewinella aurantiaca]TXF87107.1 SDR family oxidoreductase [Neolewinella aurantiaca]